MPRGFLVKRQKSANTFSYRVRHSSEEDRSDSGSEPDNNYYVSTHPFGSPDSGYCQSPISLTCKDPGARLLTTAYPEVTPAAAALSNGSARPVPELVQVGTIEEPEQRQEEEQTQPMDYSTNDSSSRTPSSVATISYTKKEEKDHPVSYANINLRRPSSTDSMPEAIPHLTRPTSTDNGFPSSRYPGVDHSRGCNFNAADFYSQLKFHHSALQYHHGAMLNGRLPPPPHTLPPGSTQEDVMMDTGRPESTCSSSPRSSPAPSVGTPTHTQQGSPFYFSNFDRLSVSSPGGGGNKNANPVPSVTSSMASNPPSAPSTPGSPGGKKRSASNMNGSGESKPKTPKKTKAMRKIKFELEDKSSPVSGTFIREESEMSDPSGGTVVCGDIDTTLNMVEVTPEARRELEKIENKIGDYVCQLCKEFYTDAFTLAQHKCSRIVHIEYRCPECDKLFNCPANLASHRRWHKPRPNNNTTNNNNNSSSKGNTSNNNNNNNKNNNRITATDLSATTNGLTLEGQHHQQQQGVLGQTIVDPAQHRSTPSPGSDSNEGLFECEQCGKKFRRQAYLRKHMASHADDQPCPCQFCGKVLRSETARAKHVLQHALAGAPSVGAKDFPCGVCAAVFPSRPALERHARLHTSEVYSCKYCSNTFYSSPGLTRHINKCHPSENRQVILLQMPVNRPC